MSQNTFTTITRINTPAGLKTDEQTQRCTTFEISFEADGKIPFPQLIIRGNGQELLFPPEQLKANKARTKYTAKIKDKQLPAGDYQIQAEGCKKEDISQSGGDDWIKEFANFTIARTTPPKIRVSQDSTGVKVYYGIHKHMHQPYYDAADTNYWDGEKDEIFGCRTGAYTHYIPAAIRQYIDGGLPHGGLSTSWSGTLIEQLDRCERDGLCGGAFTNWKDQLRSLAQETTSLGHPRICFSAFGHFHPLMALIPSRNIVKHITMHRDCIQNTFGAPASDILFPPETAFHARMIPALNEAGIRAVIYDSIHRYRACQDYPYAGSSEGMLPPNPAEQENPSAHDWFQMQNVWAGSQIAPSLLRPEYLKYTDPQGKTHKIIGVPAERYIGNEDARGGYGALQYGQVLGQVYDNIVQHGTYDPKHPPFFLLHSDGDNYGGGTDSYYMHNTGAMINWLHEDPRFELTTIEDYLEQFPPDPKNAVHIEPGSWSGADNGDPQFKKWFSMYDQPYSPDLNSWAVLTAFQNAVHSAQDAGITDPAVAEAERLMLTAETSCYWYWTGQDIWDQQVTNAANKGYELLRPHLDKLTKKDKTGPTIFAPWIFPENPGGKMWGEHGSLKDAPKQATLHTFIHDLNGIKRAEVILRTGKTEKRLPLDDHGPYPSQTNPTQVAHYMTAELPEGIGDTRYYIEAQDNKGHTTQTALERIFLA